MSGQAIFRVGVSAAATLVLLCSATGAQDASTNDDSEPIRYVLAPAFWEQVERVLNSDVKLYWTNNGVINEQRGERETILALSREALAKLKSASMPQTAGLKRVRVFPTPLDPQYSLLGFLIREEPDAWIVFTSAWRVERVKRVKHTRIEDADLSAEIDAALRLAATIQDNRDRARGIGTEIPAEINDGHNRFQNLTLLFDLAYLAFRAERREAVEPLLRAAFYQRADWLTYLADDLAWRQFEPAVLDLNDGTPRAGLATRFRRIAAEFPGGRYEQQASDYATKLQQMAAEDAAPRKPLARLPPAERVQELVFRLRECNAVQHTQPGECWIPSSFQPVENEQANAADLLIAEGFDAVPALIEALEDTRLTRSYGFYRNFAPWRYVLEVRDAAIQTLVVIADDRLNSRLYSRNSTSGYFSNDKPEARAAAIRRIRDWWAEAQAMGEAEWLRARLSTAKQSRATLLRRLVVVEKHKALPEVRKWLAEEKYNRTYAYQLLLRAGGADAIAEVKALADPTSQQFDFEALCGLHRERLITPAEYKAALRNGTEAIAKRESAKLPPQMLTALTETGDRQCTLVVAERLRGGKSNFDQATQWALSKVNDPKIGAEVAGYLLPFFDDAETAKNSGWRQYYNGERDIYRVKDQAAFMVNRLLDSPMANFADLTPPERDAEIDTLRKICSERGIQPAFVLQPAP